MSEAKLLIQQVGDVTSVDFQEHGLLDAAPIARVRDALFRLVDDMDRRNLILDFSKVRFMSSTAIGVLMTLRKKVDERKGKLVICGLRAELMQIFKIMKIQKLFMFCDGSAAAMKVFGLPAEE
ncbi:MAG: STAS domain-containing protein [Phycisphaerae bacterium]|nr:STAS domain-containing protein [Phycisphaerae bacterium]